jgi:hypothetical protein
VLAHRNLVANLGAVTRMQLGTEPDVCIALAPMFRILVKHEYRAGRQPVVTDWRSHHAFVRKIKISYPERMVPTLSSRIALALTRHRCNVAGC